MLQSPNASSTENQLLGVAALSNSDVWAVGYYAQPFSAPGAFLNLAMHWNGANWTITSVPNPAQNGADQLKKVAAISTNNVWAIGGHGASYTLRWNGSSWSQVPLPAVLNRGAAVNTSLEDIVALSANDVWVVGAKDSGSGSTLTLAMRWNGTQWTEVPTPNVAQPPGSPSPFYSQALRSVTALGPNNVWAAGYYLVGNSYRTLVLHWNGLQWSIVSSPNGPTGDGLLNGIAASGPAEVLAVGEYDKSSTTQFGKGLAMAWNGTAWNVALPPMPAGAVANPLNSVTARGAADFYATGQWQNSAQGLNTYVLRWNGAKWSQLPSDNMPGSGTGANLLQDITRDSSGNIWTVGAQQQTAGNPLLTMVQRSTLPPAALTMTGVVSRKTHGDAGVFDIDLPMDGPAGVESRLPTNGEYVLVFTFSTPVASVNNAVVSAGSANIASREVGPNTNQYIVRLTGVNDVQEIAVRLDGVNSVDGAQLPSATARMAVLVGDTNGNRSVNSSDVSQTKANAGAPVTNANFRADVNSNGAINTSDIGAVKAKSGNSL
jgi:hypothetical protein